MSPPAEDVMEALASGLEAGLSPAECWSTLARAGAAAAHLARELEEASRATSSGSALAAKLAQDPAERTVIAIGDEAGKLAGALRWVIGRRATRRARRRAIVGVAIAPILIGVVTLLLEPLPSVMMGTGSFAPMLRGLGWAVAGSIVAWIVLRRASRIARVRAALARVPIVASFARLETDAAVAGIVGAFAERDVLEASPRVVRALVDDAHAAALDRAAAEPRSALAGMSESLALAISVGQRVGDLPARARAYEASSSAKLTARLRMLARILAWAFALLATLHATRLVMQLQLPNLGGELTLPSSPELLELQKELENAGK